MGMKQKLKDTYINLHSIDYKGSICDGPGIRTIIFFQGCNRHCPGCHNPETWPFDLKNSKTVFEIVNEIEKFSKTKRITISGGEPMLQKKGLIILATELHKLGYDIALYTSYEIENISEELLYILNYVKCGPYDENLQTTLQYYGSTNQKFIKLKDPLF